MKTLSKILRLSLVFAGCLYCTDVAASVIAVGPGDFPPGAVTITFDGLNDGTEVGGLVIDGVLFNYNLPVGPGDVVIGHIFGATNHIAPPYPMTWGDNIGVSMILTLPAPATMFGYGYALNTFGQLANATSIYLFLDHELVGSLTYDGAPDPTLTGGFAGIQSTIPFDTVYFGFDEAATIWAFDNVMFYAVPDPCTLLLFTSGLGLAAAIRSKIGC